MQVCIHCKINKPLNDFYKHKGMANGHLNVCKICKKDYQRDREGFLRSTDSKWVEFEKARARDKYYRLGYRTKKVKTRNPVYKRETMLRYYTKYPEKRKSRSSLSSLKDLNTKGYHLHHWSYNDIHLLDVIELEVKFHYYLHRNLKYNQDLKIYMTKDGELLDSKIKHLEFISKIRANFNL